MLPKSHRLSHRDFVIAKSLGHPYKTPHFSAIVHQTGAVSRFAVVTSSKLDKRAVIRNRLRRRIYYCIKATGIRQTADIIIYPYKSMLNLSHAETGTILNSFLSSLTPTYS